MSLPVVVVVVALPIGVPVPDGTAGSVPETGWRSSMGAGTRSVVGVVAVVSVVGAAAGVVVVSVRYSVRASRFSQPTRPNTSAREANPKALKVFMLFLSSVHPVRSKPGATHVGR